MIVAGAVGGRLAGNVEGAGGTDELGGKVGLDEVGVDVPVMAGVGFRLLGELPSEAAEDCGLTELPDGAEVPDAGGEDLVVLVP